MSPVYAHIEQNEAFRILCFYRGDKIKTTLISLNIMAKVLIDASR